VTNRAYKERESSEDLTANGRPPEWSKRNGLVLSVGNWRESPISTSGVSDPLLTSFFGRCAGQRTASKADDLFSYDTSFSNPHGLKSPALSNFERQMTQFSSDEEVNFEKLRKEYVLVLRSEVESFLRSHRSLIDVLLDAVPQFKSCFGPDSILQLRLGGEEADAPNVVCGIVLWSGSLDAARAALDIFDQSWWMNNVTRTSGRVVFDYELA
jgi:hypothetical protein